MLGKTTVFAIQALIYLELQDAENPLSPREIAAALDLSPTYLAKVTNLLVKSGILKAHRGVQGGVTFAREAEDISLLQIVEACQGQIAADYCREVSDLQGICAFHRAMLEVHESLVSVLSRWTLADLVANPGPSESVMDDGGMSCLMAKFCLLTGRV